MEKTTQVQTSTENTELSTEVLTAEQAMQELTLPNNYGQNMTPETTQKIENLKKSIDIHDEGKVVAFGREQQAQIGKFSDSIFNGVATKEIGEAGDLLAGVIADIQGYKVSCTDETSGFLSFLKKQKSKLQNLQTKYKSVAENTDVVIRDLQQKDLALGNIVRGFEDLYNENLATYDFLTMAIYAGEQVLAEEEAKHEVITREAKASGDNMQIQRAADYKDEIEEFRTRINDLYYTRAICYQQAPQIRSIQKGAKLVSNSIKRSISTAIPLWKNQMAMALGMRVIEKSLDAVNAVNDFTNEVFRMNATKNKELTLKAANAAKRGVIDIETINFVNNELLETLSGSYEIAQQTITERAEGLKQLKRNEDTLKAALVQYAKLN